MKGDFVIDSSKHSTMSDGTFITVTKNANIRVTNNRYENMLDAIEIWDVDRSRVLIANNHVDVFVGPAVWLSQNSLLELGFPKVDESAYDIINNTITVADGGQKGISYIDDNVSRDTSPTALKINSNNVQMGNVPVADSTAIEVKQTEKSAAIILNKISGSASVGVDVDHTRGCFVSHNDFSHFDEEKADIRLGEDTSRCTVLVSNPSDKVVDDGTNNQIILP
jgi:hypothetical protein